MFSWHPFLTSLVAQWQRICLPVQETQVQCLDQEDPLEKEMATYFSIFAWEVPQRMLAGYNLLDGQRVGHDLKTKQNDNKIL